MLREEGRGKKESGRGNQEEGRGNQEEGIRNQSNKIVTMPTNYEPEIIPGRKF
ncbi:MAG: hypothetical protein WCD53_24365 [Microcoleus sp.]